jgi:hypothetical protein
MVFSPQDFWWLKPKEQDNPLPALQLGVQIVQNRAKMDLAERDLANDIARTAIMWEEMLAKQRIQTQLMAGNSEFAKTIAGVTDWLDDEQWAGVMESASRNPMVVGGKAYLGAQHMRESARTAKRLEEDAQSRIAARTDRSELNRLAEERRALLADSTIDVNDSRIAKNARDTAIEERRLMVQEGNLGLREREITGKETRLGLRERYLNERNAVDREEKAKLAEGGDATEQDRLRKLYNLKRREVTSKFYGPNAPKVTREGVKTEDRTNAPPAVVAPSGKVRVISPDGRPGFIPESQLEEALKAGYTKP